MKDGFLLIVSALVAAILAWSFWYYLGQDAFNVLMIVFLIVLVVDNVKLRKKIKGQKV